MSVKQVRQVRGLVGVMAAAIVLAGTTGQVGAAGSPPGAPADVVASIGPGPRAVTVWWQAPADAGSAPIGGYAVTATPVPGSTPAGLVATARSVTVTGVPAPTQAVISSLVRGTTYLVTVRARNGAGYGPASEPSAPVRTFDVPAVVVGVASLVSAPGRLVARWDRPASDLPITRYTVVARATRADGSVHQVATTVLPSATPEPEHEVELSKLTRGLSYSVTVTASNEVGAGPASAPSTPVQMFDVPAAVVGVTGYSSTPGAVTARWDRPASDLPITRYTVVARATRADGSVHQVTRTVLPTGAPEPPTSVEVASLTAGLGYAFTVSATNEVGPGSASAPSETVVPELGISISDRSVVEGDVGAVSMVFTVGLSSAVTVPVSVAVATADGTAGAGDYRAVSTVLTIAPGRTTASVTVRVLGDLLAEGDETFAVGLSAASVGQISTPFAVGTILENDPGSPIG